MTRSYPVGHRRGKKDVAKTQGQLSKSRWAWVRVFFGQFIIWGDYAEDENGKATDELLDIKIMHPIPGRQPLSWNLTAMTEEELVAFKHLFNTAFEWALPIVRQRDKDAQDAFNNGDDSHSRIYRQVPQLVYRSGPEHQYGEGVQHGSEDAAGVPQSDDDLGGGLRADGGPVAERDEEGSGSQDDGQETDLGEGVRSMGEVAD